MNQEKIKAFVMAQLKAGLSTEDITIQLRTAHWSEADIEAAFAAAREEIAPTPIAAAPAPRLEMAPSVSPEMHTSSSSETEDTAEFSTATTQPSTEQPTATLPPPSGRGSFKTGLKLFTQSIRIMRSNPGLLRYAAMSTGWTVLIMVLFAAIAIIDSSKSSIFFASGTDIDGSSTLEPTLYGFMLIILVGYTVSTIAAFYGVAISSHALAIFRGEPGGYKDHISKARQKLRTILVFSLINLIVGYILSLLESRFRIIGWIVSKILGALWKLSTSFVLPVIADSDDSGTKAIKSSMTLFKNNWGETITGRVAAGGAVMLLYFLVGIPLFFILFIALTAALGVIGLIIALLLLLLGFLLLAIIASLADSIVTTSLYYYSKYNAIPPTYSPELLSDVLIRKKSKKSKK